MASKQSAVKSEAGQRNMFNSVIAPPKQPLPATKNKKGCKTSGATHGVHPNNNMVNLNTLSSNATTAFNNHNGSSVKYIVRNVDNNGGLDDLDTVASMMAQTPPKVTVSGTDIRAKEVVLVSMALCLLICSICLFFKHWKKNYRDINQVNFISQHCIKRNEYSETSVYSYFHDTNIFTGYRTFLSTQSSLNNCSLSIPLYAQNLSS